MNLKQIAVKEQWLMVLRYIELFLIYILKYKLATLDDILKFWLAF